MRVIAGLDVASQPESRLRREEARSQRSVIERTGNLVLEDLAGTRHEKVREYETLPYMALEVSPRALAALRSSRYARTIQADVARPPVLEESRVVVEAPEMEDIGFRGEGQTIAILDTGVEATHSFLSGKVVEEACYTSGEDCPNGGNQQVGPGAGIPCDYAPICAHGTHVSGIAAGKGDDFSGIAEEADLMAVQVFTKFTGITCGSPAAACPLSYDSDQIAALERVFDLSSQIDFASVNVSIGGGTYTDFCDEEMEAYKAAVDQLLSVGIPTVIASGNDGLPDSLSSPSCVSTAVSVGASTENDHVSAISNVSRHLSVLAPGEWIRSSVTGNGFGTWSGTSMAAPHVAGAWALLKEQNPSASVSSILGALQGTGEPIVDSRGAGEVIRPRIRIGAAAADLQTGPFPSSMTSPRRRFQSSMRFDLDWTPSSDSGSGVSGYRIERRRSSLLGKWRPFSSIGEFRRTATTFEGAGGRTYCFRVSPFDGAGIYAGPSGPRCTAVPLDDRSAAIRRFGDWNARFDADRYRGTYLGTKDSGAQLELDAVGARRFALLVTKCPGCGSLRLQWEGRTLALKTTSQKRVDLSSKKIHERQLLQFERLPAAEDGTLEVEVVSGDGHPVMIEGVGVSKV